MMFGEGALPPGVTDTGLQPQPDVDNNDPLKKELSEIGVEMTPDNKVVLYHATPKPLYKRIVAEQEIKPGNETGEMVWRTKADSEEVGNNVFLTITPEKATEIATTGIQKKRGGSVVILEVHVDPNDLLVDQDSHTDSWLDSLSVAGTCASIKGIAGDDFKYHSEIPAILPENERLEFLRRAVEAKKTEDEAELDRINKEYEQALSKLIAEEK